MSIAHAIRESVLYDERALNTNELLNKLLSTFMQRGEWFSDNTHALTFALFVSEALAADPEQQERTVQLLRMVDRAHAYISDQRACLWNSHVNPRTGKLDADGAAAVEEIDVLLLGLEVGAHRLLEHIAPLVPKQRANSIATRT